MTSLLLEHRLLSPRPENKAKIVGSRVLPPAAGETPHDAPDAQNLTLVCVSKESVIELRISVMDHSLAPTPLGFRRKAQLMMARLFGLLLAFIDWLRPLPQAPAPISAHRYGSDPAETIQFIPPKAGSPKRAPIVYIHGSGWIIMNKEVYTRQLIGFADAGYPVFNLDYPLAPGNPHPGILLSLLSALRWIGQQHPEVDAVHLMGDSAGGNLAMMLGILSKNPELLRNLGPGAPAALPLAIRSVVSHYGVLDRLSWLRNGFPGAGLMLECYGGKAVFEDRVPVHKAITPLDLEFDSYPPTFLAAGSKDRLCESTRLFARRLEAIPGTAKSKIYQGEVHGFFNMEWSASYAELRRDVFAFLEEHRGISQET